MTYRLRPSVHCAAVDGGVLFQVWDDQFVVRGPQSLSMLCERLMVALEAGTTPDAIRAALPSGVADVALHVVDQLRQRDAILDTDALSVRSVEPRLCEAFGNTVAYLESRAADPYAAFLAFRNARIRATGGGPAFLALVRGLASMGLGAIDCCVADSDVPLLSVVLQQQPLLTATLHAPGDTDRQHHHEWQLSLSVDEREHLDDLLAGASGRDRVTGPVLEAVITPELALVGPLQRTADDAGLHDAIARLTGERADPQAGTPQFRSPVLATLVGNMMAFETLNYLAGLHSEVTAGRVGYVESGTLECSTYPVEPIVRTHVIAPALAAALNQFHNQPARTPREFLDGLETLANDRFGIIRNPHPRQLTQMPLSLVTTDPDLRSPAAVIGGGDDEDAARYHAAVDAARLLAIERSERDRISVVHLSSGLRDRVARESLQMAAGHSYADWLLDGLHRVLSNETLRRGDADVAFERCAVSFEACDDAASRWYWKALTLRFGRAIEVVHLRSAACPSVHVAHVSDGGRLAAVGSGDARDTAIRSALLTALSRAQLEESGGDASGLGLFRRWQPPAPEGGGDIAADTARQAAQLDQMFADLSAAGGSVVVAPWDVEPALRRHGLLLGWVGIDGRD